MDGPSNADLHDLPARSMPQTRGYQQEMLDESLQKNIIIALDTGSGKTHIAVLRMKMEAERESRKISWFLAPTVTLCEQQRNVINMALPVSVGLISGALEPDQWKDATLWQTALSTHRIMVTTPQVLLDALRHGYILLGRDINLLIFDEAHHAVDNHPYNRIMKEFYFDLLPRPAFDVDHNYVRPMILGLTASPIFGGNIVKAFQTIEGNLDSSIRGPRRHREELASFVHRPRFKRVLYNPPDEYDPPFSTNLAALESVIGTLDIEDDPYVQALREQLAKVAANSDAQARIDQKLSKVILKRNSFTHKGLRDFARSAGDICHDLGVWAADWYVGTVVEQARRMANPYNRFIPNWKDEEKAYLLSILDQVVITPSSLHPDDIVDDSSDKVRALVECLLAEKADAESHNESYSGLIFVTRRDAVITLVELLSHHPLTANLFHIGCLLGTSDNYQRRSFLDITRTLLKQSQEETLMDFKIGERNLIVSTSVAEEGIDIQACGSVIRWDPPQNMASWAQSRGRARRKRSTFTLMFEDGGVQQKDVAQWECLEREMIQLYTDNGRRVGMKYDQDAYGEHDDEELEYRVESTQALLTLHSAIAHLAHFCAMIPNSSHVDHRPLYDIDPPELPEGWHSFDNRSTSFVQPYRGPYGSKVTLPKLLRSDLRVFSTERRHPTKISAHRHVAFKAYRALHEAKLLNDNLLPLTSVVEPHLEEEVKALWKDVEKRLGTANVPIQMDPWAPEDESNVWWSSELAIDNLPPLCMFTRVQPTPWPANAGPTLYLPGCEPVRVCLRPQGKLELSDERIFEAQEYTRRLFWSINGTRMKWSDLDFSYLFLPSGHVDDSHWDTRRSWLTRLNSSLEQPNTDAFFANAQLFGDYFSFPDNLAIIRNGPQFAKAFRFVRWRYDPMSMEEERTFRQFYSRFDDLEITYPLLVVRPIPPRTNFLLPIPSSSGPPPVEKFLLLLPRLSAVTLLSATDADYAFLLPTVLRSLSMSMTVNSLRKNLFSNSPLYTIPINLLMTAITAPVSQERSNYQRLETLGDTVLKFIVSIQLLAEYPLWHEGYLSRKKDHSVSNARLAKDAIAMGLYRWIIRDRMLGKKWRPKYSTAGRDADIEMEVPEQPSDDTTTKKAKKGQELSTKVLADVVEALIGAAFIHGGFDLGFECTKLFDLGLRWQTIPTRIETMINRVEHHDDLPPQLADVERMLGYTFTHKLLLIEALTHASYQKDLHTISYERMEFLGDSVLDMVITDYLYHAPGKEYSPGHLFLRKCAMVNAHLLAFICLRCSLQIDAAMPQPEGGGQITLLPDSQRVYLWQCLLHSSHRILEDQASTFARYCRAQEAIEGALQSGSIFPWAALTRLQAPKIFSDMVESLLGAVYLDSHGNLKAARHVLRTLGIMQILERIVHDDVDVLHPVSRLSLWEQKSGKELTYTYEKEKGNISCVISVDGKEEVRVAGLHRGRASQEEVRLTAAEEAIKIFRLRDVNVSYSNLKRKRTKKKKKKDL